MHTPIWCRTQASEVGEACRTLADQLLEVNTLRAAPGDPRAEEEIPTASSGLSPNRWIRPLHLFLMLVLHRGHDAQRPRSAPTYE